MYLFVYIHISKVPCMNKLWLGSLIIYTRERSMFSTNVIKHHPPTSYALFSYSQKLKRALHTCTCVYVYRIAQQQDRYSVYYSPGSTNRQKGISLVSSSSNPARYHLKQQTQLSLLLNRPNASLTH